MRQNQLLGKQADSRERLLQAARRWAELAEVGNAPLHEQDCGVIVNRGGWKQKVTVFVQVESVGRVGDGQ